MHARFSKITFEPLSYHKCGRCPRFILLKIKPTFFTVLLKNHPNLKETKDFLFILDLKKL